MEIVEREYEGGRYTLSTKGDTFEVEATLSSPLVKETRRKGKPEDVGKRAAELKRKNKRANRKHDKLTKENRNIK